MRIKGNPILKARKLLLLLAVLLVAIPAAALAASKTTTQTASKDGVSAKLTYKSAGKDQYEQKDVHLKITTAGKTVFDGPASGKVCKFGCQVPSKALAIAPLVAGKPASVVLSLYSGGAHCCSVDAVFAKAGSKYVATWHDFGDPGAKLEPIGPGGTSQFVTADDSFAYEFTDYAESGLPLKILKFYGGKFSDVTRSHPALLVKNAKLYWKAYLSDHDSGHVGLIAAWVADEYNLGQFSHANTTLSAQVKKGKITHGFVVSLKKFLKKLDYPS